MRKAFVVMLTVLYLISSIGCATVPKKEEVSQKDIQIQNLTEENAALRKEIDRLTRENETLSQEKIQAQTEEEELKDIK